MKANTTTDLESLLKMSLSVDGRWEELFWAASFGPRVTRDR